MRLVRPLVWLVLAGAALVGFVALGSLNETPLRWGDLGGWLDEVSLDSALVEVARWLGIALAVYVIVVAALVLLSELAALAHALPAARLLHRVARAVALPTLRRRLAEASTATAITVSAMSVSGGVGLAASPAAELTLDAPVATPPGVEPVSARVVLPAGVAPEDVTGFDLAPPPAAPSGAASVTVKDGDTMWDLITAHYGRCDRRVAGAGRVGVRDRRPQRHLHRPGVDAARARLFAGAAGRSAGGAVGGGWRGDVGAAHDRRRRHAVGHLGGSLRVRVGGPGVVDRRLQRPRGSVRHPDRHRDHPAATRRRRRPAPATGSIRADPAGGGPDPAGGGLAGG